jgi:hypothetical protein
VAGVDITREELVIDLCPLAHRDPAHVDVTYHLHNRGSAKRLELVFVSASSGVGEFEVRLGDQLIPSTSTSVPLFGLPVGWSPPEHLPGLDRKETFYLPLHEGKAAVLAFTVDLPAGPSVLRARYRVRVAGTDEGYPTTTWQFPYVLAPARKWGSFGSLEVLVHLPPGWQHVSTPELSRDGDTLRGTFPNLPADTLAICTRLPIGSGLDWVKRARIALYVLALVGGGALCWWGASRYGARRARQGKAPAVAGEAGYGVPFVLAFVWAGLIVGAAVLADRILFAVLAGQESPYFHERFPGLTCLTFVLIVFVFPPGVALAFYGGQRGYRRALRART